MTYTNRSQLDTRELNGMVLGTKHINWLGALALLGTLLLFIGVTLSSAAAISDQVLPQILEQLKEQGKKIKDMAVMDLGENNSQVVITLMNGEVRKYDGKGKLRESKDEHGKVTTYEEGMPIEERDANGNVIAKTKHYRSQAGTLLKSVKNGKDGIETKSYDNKGNIVQVTNSQGTKFFSNYMKNNKGQTVSYLEQSLQNGKTTRIIQDPESGQTIAKIDQNGVRTDIENQKGQNGEVLATIERETTGNVTVKRFQDGQQTEETKNGVRTVFENFTDNHGTLIQRKEKKMVNSLQGTFVDLTVKDFDAAGRIWKQTDRSGEHQYKYDVDDAGRVKTRHETVFNSDGSGKPKEKTTYYDDAGRVTGLKEDGRNTKTNYMLDDKGNVTRAIESVSYSLGWRTYSQTVVKEMDSNGRMKARTDDSGVRTEFGYDGKGNRTSSESEFEQAKYSYDPQGNMVKSSTVDHRGILYTEYDPKTTLASKKVKIKNSGVIEVTSYGFNDENKRMGITLEAFGVRSTICRDASSDQPEKVIYTKFNGKQTTTSYDYMGENMLSSREVGSTGVTDTLYNALGKPEQTVHIDQWGRTQTTLNSHSEGRMVASLMIDKKGVTETKFNKFEEAVLVIRKNQIGYPRTSTEERIFKNGVLVQSLARDIKGTSVTKFNENELAVEVDRSNRHGFPRANKVKNKYNESGEMVASTQLDKRGMTLNSFDKDGMMEDSVRCDIYGFPKRKYTHYNYEKGEMVSSIADDQRQRTVNLFDADGLMCESNQTRKFGYPREIHSTYDYNSDGYMHFNQSKDNNGETRNYYNQDELVAVSFRANKLGHAREQWTINQYDGEGFMTFSKETDLKGCTVTKFDMDALSRASMRYDKYGVLFGRETLSVNDYDEEGFMTVGRSKNIMTIMEKKMDRDSLTTFQWQLDRFGVLDSREKISDKYIYDGEGRMKASTTTDQLGVSNSHYDIHGDAVATRRDAKIGTGATRMTLTRSSFQSETGMTTRRVAVNCYGTTYSMNFDPVTGLESKQISSNNFGLLAARVTKSQVSMDIRHGLTRNTLAVNDYGSTETHFDTEKGGIFGVSTWSVSNNNFGLNFSRKNFTKVEADIHTGQNRRTEATSKFGKTLTEYDSLFGGVYGVSVKSYTQNYYGLGSTLNTATGITANLWNGMNDITVGKNAYGTTMTWYDSKETGVSTHSEGWNNFGLNKAAHTKTEIKANPFNGLNHDTIATNEYGVTKTLYDDKFFGVSTNSESTNNYGLLAAHITNTNIRANVDNGLNKETQAVNLYGTTITKYDHEKTGVSHTSLSKNNFGLLAAQINMTDIKANTWNGLNEMTLARNAYGTTITRYDKDKSGVALESLGFTNYGLGATRKNYTQIMASHDTGLNEQTKAYTNYGVTTTLYDAQYGVAKESLAVNNFGLVSTMKTNTQIKANVFNGLNERTVATSAYGITETEYESVQYGLAKQSHGMNNFGLINTRETTTVIESSCWNGLNKKTTGFNKYGVTKTLYDDVNFGISLRSDSENYYGLGATLKTSTLIAANTYNGLNKKTVAHNEYGDTITTFDQEKHGVAKNSVTFNNFGLGANRKTSTDIMANVYNGLNEQTTASNAYGKTVTKFDAANYGVAKESFSLNNFGLGASLQTHTNIQANVINGLNEATMAENAYGTTFTLYDKEKTGVSKQSMSMNRFGLNSTKVTVTDMIANTWNGLNIETVAKNNYGETISHYDDREYGVTKSSDSKNRVGLVASRKTHTAITANTWNGLNANTLAENQYGTTYTEYDSLKTGVARRSISDNLFGLGAAAHTENNIGANLWNGLNEWTFAKNAYGWTYTKYDGKQSGVSLESLGFNRFGLGAAHLTSTKINADRNTGLNQSTMAENAYGKTFTAYDNVYYGVSKWSYSENNFGLVDARNTHTTVDANVYNGLNRSTMAVNDYGSTYTEYDSELSGVSKYSKGNNNFGLDAAKVTETDIFANTWNGLNILTVAENEYSWTKSFYDSEYTGATKGSIGINKFGLGATRYNINEVFANDWNGLNEKTVAYNHYGRTTTRYDAEHYGVTLQSWAHNYYGLEATADTATKVKANINNGLNKQTLAENKYGMTLSIYDDERTGVTTRSLAWNYFGLLASRFSITDIQANSYNGLNERTTASNLYGTTVTEYDSAKYGVATRSFGDNNFGLFATRMTTTNIKANAWNGLNIETEALNDYGRTLTQYDKDKTGVARLSESFNRYGLGSTTHTYTTINSSTFNGLNKDTFAKNDYGETTTFYDDTSTGVARESNAHNNFGLNLARDTKTNIQCNIFNGLNERTYASNGYGETWTWYDSQSTGVGRYSWAKNKFGLYASRITFTDITCNENTGLNTSTVATSNYGSTYTRYASDGTGVSVFTRATNNYGLGAAKVTDTEVDSNGFTGLNRKTVGTSDYGTTTTYFDDKEYGVSLVSETHNNFGLNDSRNSKTFSVCNRDNGLNEYTLGISKSGTTMSWFDSLDTGVSKGSLTMNNYGLLASRVNVTKVEANVFNGLNTCTWSMSAYGETYTEFDDVKTGSGKWSITSNHYGLMTTRNSLTVMKVNTYNGLNESTTAESLYGRTVTTFDSEAYGVALSSVSDNNFGLFASRHTTTVNKTNLDTGLSEHSYAINDYGWTETFFESKVYGMAVGSRGHNKFGLGAALDTVTTSETNFYNGLNRKSVTVTHYGTTTSYFDDQHYGVSVFSKAENGFGLLASRVSYTWIDADTNTGLNKYTYGKTKYGDTESWFAATDARGRSTENTGVATTSRASNHYGIGLARVTTTNSFANLTNGLNKQSVSTSGYSTTTTDFDDLYTGVSNHAISDNFYGFGSTQHNETWTTANTYNGMNSMTYQKNDYGQTQTYYDDEVYGIALASDSFNNYGILMSRLSHTELVADPETGLNVYSLATNDAGVTLSVYDTDSYGCADYSISHQNFGLGESKDSITDCTTNKQTGLNMETIAISKFGTTISSYDSWSTGAMNMSVAHNNRGAVYGRDVTTTYDVNLFTGLNRKTTSDSLLNKSVSEFDPVFGTSKSSVSTTKIPPYGATLGKVTTTIYDGTALDHNGNKVTCVVNQRNGLNVGSFASNGLNETRTFYDDAAGVSISSVTYNRRGARMGRDVWTKINSDVETGLNIETFGYSKLNSTWTKYDSLGLSSESLTVSNAAISVGYGIVSHTQYNVDPNTGQNLSTVTQNKMGTTTSWFNQSTGFLWYSENVSVFGVTGMSKTWYEQWPDTGQNKHSYAQSYSSKPGFTDKMMSYTDTYYLNDEFGFQDYSISTGTTGAYSARRKVTVTSSTDVDKDTGVKLHSKSYVGYGSVSAAKSGNTGVWTAWSESWADNKGIDMMTDNHTTSGPIWGRNSRDYTIKYDQNTGNKRQGYSSSQLSASYSYFDKDGLPESFYQMKRNTYGAAKGGRITKSWNVGAIQWTGSPSILHEESQSTGYMKNGAYGEAPLSATDSYMNENGATYMSISGNLYGANGDQYSTTYYDVNPETGINRSSVQYKSPTHGHVGTSTTYYDPTYGTPTYAVSTSYKKDGTASTSYSSLGSNPYSGTSVYSVTTLSGKGAEHYASFAGRSDLQWNVGYDYHGRKIYDWTRNLQDNGKDGKKWCYWTTNYQYNDWTGMVTHSWTSGETNHDHEDKTMDEHGVETGTARTYASDGHTTTMFTSYYGSAPRQNPSQAVSQIVNDDYGVVSEINSYDLTEKNSGRTDKTYNAKWLLMYLKYGTYVSKQRIVFSMDNNDNPIAGALTDEKGTEYWEMSGASGYDQSNIVKRYRNNFDGSYMNWDYSNDLPVVGRFHRSATTEYKDYMGIFSGTGTETYSEGGILTSMTLTNDKMLGETITFENDKTYLTYGTGTRSDGVITTYAFTNANELACSADDKGITNWNVSTNRRQSTTGDLGTFTYTYSGGAIAKITGQMTTGGTADYDKYFNLLKWTDSKHVVHTYTPLEKAFGTGYVTKATEWFTDTNGNVWQGTTNFKAGTGFYFAGSVLTSVNALVNATSAGADNAVTMNMTAAFNNVKSSIYYNYDEAASVYNYQAETYTYMTTQDTHAAQSLATYKSNALSQADLTGRADVKVTIGSNGNATATFSNIHYNETQYTKVQRYKPGCEITTAQGFVVSTSENKSYSYVTNGEGDSTVPTTGDYRNVTKMNDPFHFGGIGDSTSIEGAPVAVQIGTRYWENVYDETTNTYTRVQRSAQAYSTDDNGYSTPLYQEEIVYGLRFTIKTLHWSMQEDGWMYQATGTKQEVAFTNNSYSQSAGYLVAGPVKQQSNYTKTYTATKFAAHTPVGKKDTGITLGGAEGGENEGSLTGPGGIDPTKAQNIVYTFGADNFPIAASITDSTGSEYWEMIGGSYDQSAIKVRYRTNNDSSTYTWDYSEDIPAKGKFHMAASTKYLDFMGLFSGTGHETYNSQGLLTEMKLDNQNMWDETIKFENDGQHLTIGTGTREDGVKTAYVYNEKNQIVASADNIGITTWNASQNQRTGTTSEMGTFSYTYSGAAITSIHGEMTAGGLAEYDKYFNLQNWTDKMGVRHTYTSTETVSGKGYVTKARESFTDKNNAVWSGLVEFAANGFFFVKSSLSAHNVKVTQKGADNTVTMDMNAAYTMIKNMLGQKNTEKETFTWNAPGDAAVPRSLGDFKQGSFSLKDLTGMADVEISIGSDGSSVSVFNKIGFKEAEFQKKNRFKPTHTTTSYTVMSDTQPVTGDNRDMIKYNDKYMSGTIGKVKRVIGQEKKQTGMTRETYYVEFVPKEPGNPAAGYNEVEHTAPGVGSDGKAYESRTRDIPVYTTQWTIEEETWSKENDGWQYVDMGSKSETYYDYKQLGYESAKLSLNTGTLLPAPVKQQSTYTKTYTATSLAAYIPTQTDPGSAVDQNSNINPGSGDLGDPFAKDRAYQEKVAAAFHKLFGAPDLSNKPNGQLNTNFIQQLAKLFQSAAGGGVQVSGPMSAEDKARQIVQYVSVDFIKGLFAGAGTPENAAARAQLFAQFKGIQSIADVETFMLNNIVSKTNGAAIVAAISASAPIELIQIMTDVFNAMFDSTYSSSLLAKLIELSISSKPIFDEIKIAIEGGVAVSEEMKEAARLAKELMDATDVQKDSDGRIVKAKDKNNVTHEFSYDATGITENLTYANGTVCVKRYDTTEKGKGRLISENMGDKSRTFDYAADGQVTVVERTEGGTTTLKYDTQGRLAKVEENEFNSSYTYNGNETENYTTQRTNKSGNVLEEKTYKNNMIVEKKTQDGMTTKYSYMLDEQGKVAAVTAEVIDRDGDKTTLKYDGAGRMISAMGKDADKFQKMVEDGTMSEQAFAFELQKAMFGDPRMDSMRLDQKVTQGFAQTQP